MVTTQCSPCVKSAANAASEHSPRSPCSWRATSITLSDTPRAQDNLSNFVHRLAPPLAPAPLPKMCTNFEGCAVSNFDRLSWAQEASLKFSTNARRTRGVFTCRVCRALDARRTLRCDLATVLLRTDLVVKDLHSPILKTHKLTCRNDFDIENHKF